MNSSRSIDVFSQVSKSIGKISDTYRSVSTAAYGFATAHPMLVLGAVGVAYAATVGVDHVLAADGFGAAGGGSPAGPAAGSGGGSPVGPGAAGGGAAISGNSVQACSRTIGYLEGGFGTLVASSAGLGAIIAAALGGFKAAWALFVVSVGCFILRTYLTLFLTGC